MAGGSHKNQGLTVERGGQVGAKTARTADSSRAGRVVSAAFDGRGRLVGGRVEVLPLDRARVLGPPPSDRNYHIFYQLCFGASLADRERLGLESVKVYHLLNRSSCFVAGTRDEDDYARTLEGMQELGLGAAERRAVVATVAAVLHAGNLEFVPDEAGATTAAGAGPASQRALAHLASALAVPADELEAVLCTRELSTRRAATAVSCRVTLPAETARLGRDTVVQLLYAGLVKWLAGRLNAAVYQPRARGLASAATLAAVEGYGFERAERSGFGELLANYAFERAAALFADGAVGALHRVRAEDGLLPLLAPELAVRCTRIPTPRMRIICGTATRH